jgi:hypothetical protein
MNLARMKQMLPKRITILARLSRYVFECEFVVIQSLATAIIRR